MLIGRLKTLQQFPQPCEVGEWLTSCFRAAGWTPTEEGHHHTRFFYSGGYKLIGEETQVFDYSLDTSTVECKANIFSLSYDLIHFRAKLLHTLRLFRLSLQRCRPCLTTAL